MTATKKEVYYAKEERTSFVFNFVTLRKQLPTTALNGGKT